MATAGVVMALPAGGGGLGSWMDDGVLILNTVYDVVPDMTAVRNGGLFPAGGGGLEFWIDGELIMNGLDDVVPGVQSGGLLQTAVVRGGEEKMCVVCQDDVVSGDTIGILRCGHNEYHRECIEKWLRKKNRCPLCNATAV